ncbi:hypothetical protein DENSPDRAFT_688327 [Dentipellis sp. KUC8613]|nr:hypothetical protein DENSPDRAFT_688327 [Dentipellis sp. KUC8613]
MGATACAWGARTWGTGSHTQSTCLHSSHTNTASPTPRVVFVVHQHPCKPTLDPVLRTRQITERRTLSMVPAHSVNIPPLACMHHKPRGAGQPSPHRLHVCAPDAAALLCVLRVGRKVAGCRHPQCGGRRGWCEWQEIGNSETSADDRRVRVHPVYLGLLSQPGLALHVWPQTPRTALSTRTDRGHWCTACNSNPRSHVAMWSEWQQGWGMQRTTTIGHVVATVRLYT